MCVDEKLRTRMNEKRSMPEEHTLENTINESSRQIRQLNHKPKETRIPEDLEDTDTSSEGPKSNAEDHWTRIEEERESWPLSKKGKNTDKTSIISPFNALNPLNWLY